jgi:hypothetical protein
MENEKTSVVEDVKTEDTVETKKTTFVQSIKSLVQDALVNSGDDVKQYLIQSEANEIFEKRKSVVKKVYLDLVNKTKELDKLVPDFNLFDEDGKKTVSSYTDATKNSRNKLKQEIKNIEELLTNAFEKNEFDRLIEKYGKSS